MYLRALAEYNDSEIAYMPHFVHIVIYVTRFSYQ